MQESDMRGFGKSVRFLLTIHVLGLAALSLFRVTEFVALRDMVSPAAKGEAWLQMGAFVRGVWFDNVIACYIMLLPMLVVLGASAFGSHHRGWRRFAVWWFAILYPLAFVVSAANIPYFAFFFKNINSGIFEWFGYAGTTAGMVFQESSWWLYILLFFAVTAVFEFLLWRVERLAATVVQTANEGKRSPQAIALRTSVTLALLGLCLFGIRGRTGYNPIKISAAYYCNDSFLNQLGINPAFNLLTSALDDMRRENKALNLMPTAEAVAYARRSLGITGAVDSLYVLRRRVGGDTVRMRPNVVIILMESMSANFMRSFGAKEELTPVLDSLFNNSLAFTNFYSTGIHTNMGMTGTLYSCPAIMKRNLMKGTVTPKRGGLPTVLKENGYHNMFFMTHESQYDNMKAFFAQNGYHGKLVGKPDAELPQSYNHIPLIIFGKGIKPGVHDGLGCQIDVMPTLLGMMGIGYTFDGFGQDLLRQPRDMVFYSADDKIVARSKDQVFIYLPGAQKSFTYAVRPGWQLAETKPAADTEALKRYVFAMIETAEFNERQSRKR